MKKQKIMQQTLSIIKPDAVSKNVIGKIYTLFEEKNFKITKAKMCKMSISQASKFYSIHKDKPFFRELIEFMSSGPIMVQILEGHDIIKKNRQLMGNTNPKDSNPGTIRFEYGENITKNAVHGSDSYENSKKEISLFSNQLNLF